MELDGLSDIPANWLSSSGDGKARDTENTMPRKKLPPAEQPARDPSQPRHVVIAGGGVMGSCVSAHCWRASVEHVKGNSDPNLSHVRLHSI